MMTDRILERLTGLKAGAILSCGDIEQSNATGTLQCQKCKKEVKVLQDDRLNALVESCIRHIQKEEISPLFAPIEKMMGQFSKDSDVYQIFAEIVSLQGKNTKIPKEIVIDWFEEDEKAPHQLFDKDCFYQSAHCYGSDSGSIKFEAFTQNPPLTSFEIYRFNSGKTAALIKYKSDSPFLGLLREQGVYPNGPRSYIISSQEFGRFWKVLQSTNSLHKEQVESIEQFIEKEAVKEAVVVKLTEVPRPKNPHSSLLDQEEDPDLALAIRLSLLPFGS